MPSKNIVKIYIKDGVYHIYNRGVEKRKIFIDEQDYKVFLNILKRYLTSPENFHQGRKINFLQVEPARSERKNDWGFPPCRQSDIDKKIRLLCYCLMPNHFHLMVQQLTERAITEFMRRLSNAYIKYFNEKYKRVGSLFQGRYKAALIRKEEHFLYLPYYIHHNPEKLNEKIKTYSYSSYADYLGTRNTKWIYKKDLMEQFMEAEKEGIDIEKTKDILGKIILE